ncbi:DUF4229 domain-containing protein [Lacisediminihabitans changchengi]|uniref:DUF4229 domain-containing protein n=1 Tax=Lacisediminihabitans changchengi TaxID=2787634 RepID=A0A934W5X4_9MICO|nr:DUF4229 domain-containing protein [Lacisediminihabitans changchengi]MBK4349020.1 DUF4229 domain-containing protein [Lacisediminihabitans changchengi]
MKPSRQWIVYSAIRLGIFALILAILVVVGVNPIFAAIGSAAISFCLSYIFLTKQRDAVARSVVTIRSKKTSTDLDNDLENEAIDRLENRKLD